jgi:hypothetical protein
MLPTTDRTAIILEEGLYASPEMKRRGGTGAVQDFRTDFATSYRWIMGVGGSHDPFQGKGNDVGNSLKIMLTLIPSMVITRFPKAYPLLVSSGCLVNMAGSSGAMTPQNMKRS